MINTPLFEQLQADCADATTGEWYDESVAPEACKTSLDLMNSQVGIFDIYNVYDTCVDDYSGGYDDGERKAEHQAKKKTNREWREEIFGARGVSTVGKVRHAEWGGGLEDRHGRQQRGGTPSPRHPVTPSPRSPRHPITPSPHHPFTLSPQNRKIPTPA